MPIDGPLMVIDGPHGTAMAIDELRWDLSTGRKEQQTNTPLKATDRITPMNIFGKFLSQNLMPIFVAFWSYTHGKLTKQLERLVQVPKTRFFWIDKEYCQRK